MPVAHNLETALSASVIMGGKNEEVEDAETN